ncbi:MAG: ABC transporter substrate-binding protein, partial [Bacteroidota bacterium]
MSHTATQPHSHSGILLLLLLTLAACSEPATETTNLLGQPWAEIEAAANGQTVDLIMWMGDPYINGYIRDYVTPEVQERYGITLNVSSGQGNQIVSALMTEMEAGRSVSDFDMMWINGETFYQLRQIDALYGPFVETLPNAEYINFDSPFIGIDFQQPVDGYEMPWGNVQLALIYDSLRVQNPPATREELAEWVRANPGRFTFDNHFTGMTFLKSLLIDIAGGPGSLDGDFDEAAYEEYSSQLWAYLNEIKPNFWKEGRTFPGNVAQMHQLFANGEVDITMSNNDGEVDNKVLQGLFPESSRAYVLESGTIQNSHFMGIVNRSADKAGALVVANFMISPEAQLRKMNPEIWG